MVAQAIAHMRTQLSDNPAVRQRLMILFWGIIVCWLAVAWVQLYFFSFQGGDSWTQAAPGLLARTPLEITTPFLGSFEGSDKAWGMHWPGGPLLVSLFGPFIPHTPAVFVSIYLTFWLLLALATAAITWQLTGSGWMALCALVLIVSDRISFSNVFLERYETLDGALEMVVLLALSGNPDRRRGLRDVALGAAFFLFPLMQPMTMGLSIAWVVCFGLRSWALRRAWRQFWIATAATAAGWAGFLGYYLSRPGLLAILLYHGRHTTEASSPRLGTAIHRLLHIGDPTKSGTIVYLAALCGVGWLLYAFWKARAEWREFVAREEVILLAAAGLLCCMVLVQFDRIDAYWEPVWPFAVVIFCQMIWTLLRRVPSRRWVWQGALGAVLLLHCLYLPGRVYVWYKLGFINMPATLRNFANSLPRTGQLFLPEVLWQTYADGSRPFILNSIPAEVGLDKEKRYADYLAPQIHSGDVLVIDLHQMSETLINPHQQGWKQIGMCAVMYGGRAAGMQHGFELTAYQKQ